jgi:hypothetical protein
VKQPRPDRFLSAKNQPTDQNQTKPTTMERSFANLVQLQTSVVLAPFIEEEGIGALAEIENESFRLIKVNGRGVDEIKFEEILALIRSAELPIRLTLHDDDTTMNQQQEDSTASVLAVGNEEEDKEEEEEKKTDNSNDHHHLVTRISTSSIKLSAWTSRMGAAVMGTTAALMTSSNIASKQPQQPPCGGPGPTGPAVVVVPSKYTIFLQSTTGAYVPATSINNASIVTVRTSVSESGIDAATTKIQWYRVRDSIPIVLEGATRATFLPTATEVGYGLRCTVDGEAAMDTSVVTAASALFSGARRSLGTPISGIHGRHAAAGRTVRLDLKQNTLSIYQVSSATAELLHPEPLANVTVTSDHGNAKNFTLHFGPDLSPDCMLAALCEGETSDQKDDTSSSKTFTLSLQAPNRLARESLLLAIGMTNHYDTIDKLTERSILFGAVGSGVGLPSLDDHDVEPTETVTEDASTDSEADRVEQDVISEQMTQVKSPPTILDGAQSSSSSGSSVGSSSSSCQPADNDALLDQEVQDLRAKLVRKDKVINELQRQLAQSDTSVREATNALKVANAECKNYRDQHNDTKKAIDSRDRKIDSQKVELDNLKSLHVTELEELRGKLAQLERSNRTLENEKDLLTAKVEARESKLDRMKELEESLASMKEESSKYSSLQESLRSLEHKNAQIGQENEALRKANEKCGTTLGSLQATIRSLEQQIDQEKKRASVCQQELDKEQMTIQKLRAERNSYKQKSDSLAKEMNRVCRNGRTVREVEKILADDAARREEVDVLRGQKRTLTKELEKLRQAYDESLTIQAMAGLDHDAARLLERNAELDRLLFELTEYVAAKEMQLDTMRQVNDALQKELKQLAVASMKSNDV